MTQKAPGKAHRKGLTLLQVAGMFGDEANAMAWITERRWSERPPLPEMRLVQRPVEHQASVHDPSLPGL